MMNAINFTGQTLDNKTAFGSQIFFFFFQQCQSVPDLRSIMANNRLWLIAPKWGLGNDWNLNKSSFSASGHIKHTSGALQWAKTHKDAYSEDKKSTFLAV